MTNSFASLIGPAKNLLVLLPANPNLDEVAAGLTLYLVLSGQKQVGITCPTPMTVEFNRLVGVNLVKKDLGDKNLTIKFAGYQADSIEKVSYDIENGEFSLTVVPKKGFRSPTKEQVELTYSGHGADIVVLIGGNRKELFPAVMTPDLKDAKLVHIGKKEIGFSDAISLARPAASVSEVIAALIEEGGLREIGADEATNLLAGIENGSKGFSSSSVTADTFAMVAQLMRKGGHRGQFIKVNRGDFPQGSIPGETMGQETSLETVEVEKPPQEWLEKPQIYKGTSVS